MLHYLHSSSLYIFLFPFLTPLTLHHLRSLTCLLELKYSFSNVNYVPTTPTITDYNMASNRSRKDRVIDRNKRVKISDDMIAESLKKPRFMPPYFEHDALDPNLYAGGL